MNPPAVRLIIAALVWVLVAAGMLIPVGLAAASPLQASREALWIFGGMAGVAALALLLVQPMLAAGLLPGVATRVARRWHRLVGATIVAAVMLHVGGLYLYSPDDVTDALLLVAPTPFSIYGVIGLCSVALTALLVAIRSRSGMRYPTWRLLHNALSLVLVVSSIVHAVLIEGAMGVVSKGILCGLVFAATVIALLRTHLHRPPRQDL